MLLSLHNQVDGHQLRFLVIVLILQPVVAHYLNRILPNLPRKLVTTGYLPAFCWLLAFAITETRLSVAEYAGNKWFPDSIPAKVRNLQLLMRPLQYWFFSDTGSSFDDYAAVLVIFLNSLLIIASLAVGWFFDYRIKSLLLWGACTLAFVLDGVELGRDCLAALLCSLFALNEVWRVRFFSSLACLTVLAAAEAGYYRSYVRNTLRREDAVVHTHMLVSIFLPVVCCVFSYFVVKRDLMTDPVTGATNAEEDEKEHLLPNV